MRLVLQRVKEAHVDVAGETVGANSTGLLVFVALTSSDTTQDVEYLADKVIYLRIFPDEEGRMNRSILEIGGSLLVVSQFTLYGNCKKGRRPSFERAAPAEQARLLYEYFIELLSSRNIIVRTGVFQAEMHVGLVND